MTEALDFLTGLPPWLVHVVLGVGAAIENVIPAIPADSFIVLGGFVAGLGTVDLAAAFLVVWLANSGAAAGVYAFGRSFGRRFLATPRGRRLAPPSALERFEAMSARWGMLAVFLARFLPGFRALAPLLAGASGLGPARVLPPLVVASAAWYGALVRLGYLAGDNLDAALEALERANRALLWVSAAVAATLLALWLGALWRRRRARSDPRDAGPGADAPAQAPPDDAAR